MSSYKRKIKKWCFKWQCGHLWVWSQHRFLTYFDFCDHSWLTVNISALKSLGLACEQDPRHCVFDLMYFDLKSSISEISATVCGGVSRLARLVDTRYALSHQCRYHRATICWKLVLRVVVVLMYSSVHVLSLLVHLSMYVIPVLCPSSTYLYCLRWRHAVVTVDVTSDMYSFRSLTSCTPHGTPLCYVTNVMWRNVAAFLSLVCVIIYILDVFL